MSNTITGISSIQNAVTGATQPRTGTTEESFMDTLKSAIASVDRAQTDAQQSVANMMSGQGEDVHKTMIAVEKADLSFQLMMEVRNKIVSAYQDISKMSF